MVAQSSTGSIKLTETTHHYTVCNLILEKYINDLLTDCWLMTVEYLFKNPEFTKKLRE